MFQDVFIIQSMTLLWDPTKFIQAREAKNLLVKDAAEALNITPEYLSMIENGKKNPSDKVITGMGELYDRTAAFFLREDQQAAKV